MSRFARLTFGMPDPPHPRPPDGTLRRPIERSWPRGRFHVILPDILERLGKGLLLGGAVAMRGVLHKQELVRISFRSEDPGHVFVGDYPIVHVVAQYVGIIKIAVANL